MTYASISKASSGVSLDAIWRRVGGGARRVLQLMQEAQMRRAEEMVERYKRDGFVW